MEIKLLLKIYSCDLLVSTTNRISLSVHQFSFSASMYPSFTKLRTIHLITAYKYSTNIDKYIHNGTNFGNKNIFENYFMNKKGKFISNFSGSKPN